ncbi:MAG TPA: hypothetical protein VH268_00860, partial [Solirubrobacterales bacterium]|nr:hypothetical protein [Solirubrobacterales bacterium]
RLNFSGVTEEEIREGIARIGRVIKEQVQLYETLAPTPGMPGREAEDRPVDAARSASADDRDLTPSAAEADQRAADQGGSVLPFRKAGNA